MKSHKDKGRLLIAKAILQSDNTSPKLRLVALECVLNYDGK